MISHKASLDVAISTDALLAASNSYHALIITKTLTGLDRKKVLSQKGTLTLAKKFGPELVPSLAVKFEQLKGLKAMRTMLQTYLETTIGHVSAKQTLTSNMNKLSLDLDTHDTYFIKLCGGGSYTITSEMIVPTGVVDIKKSTYLPSITASR